MGEKGKSKTEDQEKRETEKQEGQQENQEAKEKKEINLSEKLDEVIVEKMPLVVAEQVENQLRSTIRGMAALVAAKLNCDINITFPDERRPLVEKQIFGPGVTVEEIEYPLPIVPSQDRVPVPIVPESLDHPYEEKLSDDMAKVEGHTHLGKCVDRNILAQMVEEKTIDNNFHEVVIQRREIPRGWKAKCKICGWDTYFQTEEMITWFYGIAHQLGADYKERYGEASLSAILKRMSQALNGEHIED